MTVHDVSDAGRTDRLVAADLPTLLTKEDVAEYFGVSSRTIEGWRQTDTGPAPIKIGKHLRRTAASVREFVLSQGQSIEQCRRGYPWRRPWLTASESCRFEFADFDANASAAQRLRHLFDID